MIGVLRGGPNAFLTDWTFDPYLNSIYYTWLQMWNDTWSNGLFNGIEAAVSAPLAYRVAVSVVPSLGVKRARPAAADPFAEPADGPGRRAEPEDRARGQRGRRVRRRAGHRPGDRASRSGARPAEGGWHEARSRLSSRVDIPALLADGAYCR